MFKKLLVLAALIATPTAAHACDGRDLLMAKSQEAAQLAHKDHNEHGFVIYELNGVCAASEIFTSNEAGHVSAQIPWKRGSHMLYFIHTHPNVGDDQTTMSDQDKDIVRGLEDKLGYEFTPGIVTNYGKVSYFLYEYKLLRSIEDFKIANTTHISL